MIKCYQCKYAVKPKLHKIKNDEYICSSTKTDHGIVKDKKECKFGVEKK